MTLHRPWYTSMIDETSAFGTDHRPTWLIAVIGDDRPGVTSRVAAVVTELGGNWLESRLAQLGGRFAGVLAVSLPAESGPQLERALLSLRDEGIWANASQAPGMAAATASGDRPNRAEIQLSGPDAPGIVRELTELLAALDVNIAELATKCDSMPYSGAPLFSAHGCIDYARGMDWQTLEEQLYTVADHLGMDLQVKAVNRAS